MWYSWNIQSIPLHFMSKHEFSQSYHLFVRPWHIHDMPMNIDNTTLCVFLCSFLIMPLSVASLPDLCHTDENIWPYIPCPIMHPHIHTIAFGQEWLVPFTEKKGNNIWVINEISSKTIGKRFLSCLALKFPLEVIAKANSCSFLIICMKKNSWIQHVWTLSLF